MRLLKVINHVGDIMAIPFFALLAWYFYNIESRTTIENILLVFSVGSMFLDMFFTYLFLFTRNKC